MEAKVDIRKLQLLNDRINQTIDALNQVRLSVHGLSHTAGLPGQVPGYGFGVPFAGGFGWGAAQGAAVPGIGWGGFSHTAGVPGFGGPQWGYGGVPNGFGQSPFAAQSFGMNPYFQGMQGLGMQGLGMQGLSHTSAESMQDPARQAYAQWLLQQQVQGGIGGIDPYYGLRVQQTFPFAQLG